MPRRRNSANVASTVRAAFMLAVEELQRVKGPSALAELIQESLTEKPLETLQAVARFIPKEHMVEHGGEVHHVFEQKPLTPEQWLEQHSDSPPEHTH